MQVFTVDSKSAESLLKFKLKPKPRYQLADSKRILQSRMTAATAALTAAALAIVV
jgi:hypothetical protein